MNLLIKNGRVLDPSGNVDAVCDILVEDGLIAKTGKDLSAPDARVVDASGCWVMPGLIDMHVHLRDPGQLYKEDIESGARAAARGGFTTILAMPNTKPPIDSPDRVGYVVHKAEQVAPVRVLQIGAATKGQKGEEAADIAGMVGAGSPAISEDGRSVMNAKICREVLERCAAAGVPFLDHCEDANLVSGGVMNAGEKAKALGFKGITNSVEDVIIARDILLAKEAGAHLHLCHCSTADSAVMVREAKAAGLSVSAEVCPHHFTLTEDDIPGDDANYKMNPPVRSAADRDALIEGLRDGTFEVIATDHAPHSAQEKRRSFAEAPFGIVGLETAVPLTVTELVEKGVLTPLGMAAAMSTNPARICGIEGGTLAEGSRADITIIDPSREWRIDKERFASRGHNTPFHGRTVRGSVRMTVCGGKIVYREDV